MYWESSRRPVFLDMDPYVAAQEDFHGLHEPASHLGISRHSGVERTDFKCSDIEGAYNQRLANKSVRGWLQSPLWSKRQRQDLPSWREIDKFLYQKVTDVVAQEGAGVLRVGIIVFIWAPKNGAILGGQFHCCEGWLQANKTSNK